MDQPCGDDDVEYGVEIALKRSGIGMLRANVGDNMFSKKC